MGFEVGGCSIGLVESHLSQLAYSSTLLPFRANSESTHVCYTLAFTMNRPLVFALSVPYCRFVIELCEPIQVKKLDIANFELFSSTPKDFLVSISDRSASLMSTSIMMMMMMNSLKLCVVFIRLKRIMH